MERREFLAGASALGASIAGCLSLGADEAPLSRTFQTTTVELEHPDRYDSAAINEDGFSTFIGTMRRDRGYGDTGVWGLAEDRPDGGPEFLGALTEGLDHVGSDIASQHALAVYALDREGPGRRHQCWLWTGVDVSAVDEQLNEITIQFDAQAEGIVVGAYAPWGTVDADQTDQYPVDLSHTIGDDGIATALPLPNGRIELDRDETSMGPGGAVQTRWAGTMSDRYALGMTCVAQWDTGHTGEIDWRVEAEFS